MFDQLKQLVVEIKDHIKNREFGQALRKNAKLNELAADFYDMVTGTVPLFGADQGGDVEALVKEADDCIKECKAAAPAGKNATQAGGDELVETPGGGFAPASQVNKAKNAPKADAGQTTPAPKGAGTPEQGGVDPATLIMLISTGMEFVKKLADWWRNRRNP